MWPVVVGVLQAAHGEDDVVGRDRLAVMPAHVLAQVERPCPTVVAHLPGAGQVGLDGASGTERVSPRKSSAIASRSAGSVA